MEAVPKLPLISFELKVSTETTHFGPKLKQYIAEAYREDPDSYGNEMHQLEGLRSSAVRPSSDTAGLATLTRYFCQLRAMQSRFPMAKGQPAACSFAWKDIYANMSCSLSDIRFEMACILYNIGALHTQLGASEPRTTPESLKASCTHFQNAAWAFMYLREHYTQPTGVDVSAENMRLLQEICLAQAQECILEKSIQDTRKPSVIGAVATQVMFFYKNSMALLGPSSGSDNIHEIIGTKLYNYWHRYLSFKSSYIGCIVCLYQGMHAEEQQKMGERVAFYQLAVDRLADARKLAKYIEPVQITQEALTFTNDVVEGKRKAAKNENEFIYHEEVPDKDVLTDLKPVCLVKSIPISFNDPEVSGPDIFSRLVPMGAHEASSMYSEEKAKLLRHVVSQAEMKNTELTEFMSSLQLDQLEVLDSDQKIPQEIVDRCAAMNAKTEIIQSLVDSMNNLAEIISDVEHSLTEIKSLIQEETMKEKEYQKVMGPRPPSIVQTELSREFHKYQEAHSRTTESNQVLHKAMTLHIANLRLLAQPLDVLRAKIPSIDNIEGLDQATMMEMRRVVGKAREMQTQRDTLIQQLREAVNSDDITAQLLARSTEPTEDIFKQELEKHTPKVKIIEQNLSAQENIINKLTSLYASYGESRRMLADVLRKREGLINALVTSYDTYEELLGKSQKGLEFYKKLSLNISQLLTRLRSTCQVQEEERAQLLSKQSSKSATPPPSAIPSKLSEVTPASSGSGPLKLKDYLPYMKNRGLARSVTPQAQIDAMPSDAYYPESIYPTSVRPAPVGSEATDLSQMKLPDGVVMPGQMPNQSNPFNRYSTPYVPSDDSFSLPSNYAYPAPTKGFEKLDDGSNLSYSTSYTPPQFSTQIAEPQYSNPYYSGTQNNGTVLTNSQNPQYYQNIAASPSTTPLNNQYNVNVYNDPNQVYGHQMMPIPETPSTMSHSSNNQINQAELNVNFGQMQIAAKSEAGSNFGAEYSQTYFSVQYTPTSIPNMATYSHAPQNSATNMVPSQVPSEYSALNYPYSNEAAVQNQMNQIGVAPNVPNPYSVANQPGTSSSPYNTDQPTANQVPNAYSAEQQYSYGTMYGAVCQGYTIYTNAESVMTSMTSVITAPQSTPGNVKQTYNTFPNEPNQIANPALAQLDAMDKPIISHVTGDALTTNVNYQNYQNFGQNNMSFANMADQNAMPNYTHVAEKNYQPSGTQNYQPTNTQNFQPGSQNIQTGYAFVEQSTNEAYSQNFQNHPGYSYNSSSGSYEYNYGSQNTYSNYGNAGQVNLNTQTGPQDPNWQQHTVYTSAGVCETVQSPSETPANPMEQTNNQIYYNSPYGYQTMTNQSNVVASNSEQVTTNYGADMNQSTYMQSGQQNTNVTFTSNNNQVSSPKENLNEPSFDQNTCSEQPPSTESVQVNGTDQNSDQIKQEPKVETKSEPSTMDLLSDIDFTVEHMPLMPEIKVPQISENAIKKPVIVPKCEPIVKPVPKEEVIQRPTKRDLFADPSLLNKFTEEVKNLQKLTDSFTNRTAGGLTVLDSKWKSFLDIQAKEAANRKTSVSSQHSAGSPVTDVVPFDDSRLTLKSDSTAYINASYYKQLAPWCIPLVISNNPTESEYSIFWRAVLENKITCVVCLLSEIELQGKSYWPTGKGQCLDLDEGLKVTLDDVTCTVYWTERKMTVTSGKTVHTVTHYQINVFPAKISCSPLVLLADKVLKETFEGTTSNHLSGAWVQCGAGAGRSAVMALLIMVMCQVRAGQLELCEMLENGCIGLHKHRTNVIEETKYLVDAYRTALYYAQGVLCSGTTLFNGETVSVPTGASILPPVPTTPANSSPINQKPQKFTRESFEEMKQSPGMTSGDMKDPLNFLDPLWSLKKK